MKNNGTIQPRRDSFRRGRTSRTALFIGGQRGRHGHSGLVSARSAQMRSRHSGASMNGSRGPSVEDIDLVYRIRASNGRIVLDPRHSGSPHETLDASFRGDDRNPGSRDSVDAVTPSVRGIS